MTASLTAVVFLRLVSFLFMGPVSPRGSQGTSQALHLCEVMYVTWFCPQVPEEYCGWYLVYAAYHRDRVRRQGRLERKVQETTPDQSCRGDGVAAVTGTEDRVEPVPHG